MPLDRPIRIVLVEDEGSDVLFMRKAFERGSLDFEVVDVSSASAFMSHMSEAASNQEPPDLVLLDLNLPGTSGLDILTELRNGDVLPHVVVMVLTSSSYRREVTEVYMAGANAFVTKPARLAELDQLVAQIENFWLGLAHLPYQ